MYRHRQGALLRALSGPLHHLFWSIRGGRVGAPAPALPAHLPQELYRPLADRTTAEVDWRHVDALVSGVRRTNQRDAGRERRPGGGEGARVASRTTAQQMR